MERNSEGKMIWVVIALIGAQLLGVDVGQILALLTSAQQHLESSGGGNAVKLLGGDLSLPALAGLYAWNRTCLKMERTKASNIASAIDQVVGGEPAHHGGK